MQARVCTIFDENMRQGIRNSRPKRLDASPTHVMGVALLSLDGMRRVSLVFQFAVRFPDWMQILEMGVCLLKRL